MSGGTSNPTDDVAENIKKAVKSTMDSNVNNSIRAEAFKYLDEVNQRLYILK